MDNTTKSRPIIITVIAAIMLLTITRLQAIWFISSLEMFSGISPDAWLGPWVSDAILGILLPIMVYFTLRGSGIKLWGLLVLYNAVGSFDYSQGLATQWLSPLPSAIASSTLVYGSLSVTLSLQLVALLLLFQNDVIHHFKGYK
ncbi:hypothetical protein HC928_03710 [bacterium]|nr:hypothetical protein [bacterium]